MTLELPRETWGDRVHRAYRLGRDQYGYTYDRIAAQITRSGWPISEQTLWRVEKQPTVPKSTKVRWNAWLFLTAMGYNPTDFSIAMPMAKAFDEEKMREVLDPVRWARHTAPQQVRSR